MQYLREAAQAVQRNLWTFVLYAAIFGVTHIVSTLLLAPFQPADEESPSQVFQIFDIVVFLLLIHAIALAQTVAFSRLGREIDRPLWKVRTDGEALKRFFMMWALINLTANGLYRLAGIDYGSGDVVSINYLLLFSGMAAMICSVPFGACIMFTGRVSSRGIGESLAPLTRQPGRSAVVFATMLFQLIAADLFLFALTSGGEHTPSLLARLGIGLASGIVQVYLDCLALAATWQLCMVDRDTVDEIDLDF